MKAEEASDLGDDREGWASGTAGRRKGERQQKKKKLLFHESYQTNLLHDRTCYKSSKDPVFNDYLSHLLIKV